MSVEAYIEYVKNNAQLLKNLIPRIRYDPNWRFDVFTTGDSFGRSIFRITVQVPDSTKRGTLVHEPLMDHHNRMIQYDTNGWSNIFIGQHNFPVEPYPMDEEMVERWVFDKIELVLIHEAMEAFLVDGVAIYYPQHIGGDPYEIVRR